MGSVKKKRNLRGRKKRIEEDLTWKERQTRWRLRRIARLEEEGNRVWVRQERIRIGEKWWSWDEEKKDLRDDKGNLRGKIETGKEIEKKGE